MKHSFEPVIKQSLPDKLARQIRGTIQSGNYRRGDRLPPIVEMAKRFEVGLQLSTLLTHDIVNELRGEQCKFCSWFSIRHGLLIKLSTFIQLYRQASILLSPEHQRKTVQKLIFGARQAFSAMLSISLLEQEWGIPKAYILMKHSSG